MNKKSALNGQNELRYPDVLTPEQLKVYEAALLKQMEGDLKRIEKELEDCQRLTAADYAVTINAR